MAYEDVPMKLGAVSSNRERSSRAPASSREAGQIDRRTDEEIARTLPLASTAAGRRDRTTSPPPVTSPTRSSGHKKHRDSSSRAPAPPPISTTSPRRSQQASADETFRKSKSPLMTSSGAKKDNASPSSPPPSAKYYQQTQDRAQDRAPDRHRSPPTSNAGRSSARASKDRSNSGSQIVPQAVYLPQQISQPIPRQATQPIPVSPVARYSGVPLEELALADERASNSRKNPVVPGQAAIAGALAAGALSGRTADGRTESPMSLVSSNMAGNRNSQGSTLVDAPQASTAAAGPYKDYDLGEGGDRYLSRGVETPLGTPLSTYPEVFASSGGQRPGLSHNRTATSEYGPGQTETSPMMPPSFSSNISPHASRENLHDNPPGGYYSSTSLRSPSTLFDPDSSPRQSKLYDPNYSSNTLDTLGDEKRASSYYGYGYGSSAALNRTAGDEGMPVLGKNGRGEKNALAGAAAARRRQKRRRLIILGSGLIALIILAAVIAGVLASKSKSSKAATPAASDGSSSSAAASTTAAAPTSTTSVETRLWTGGAGSTVTTETGSTFIYNNTFGGFWVATPFNDSAQPQSDVPALSQAWDYNTMDIAGVNLGGWLVLEPFITPSLYEPYETSATPAIDEYTLCQNLGTSMQSTLTNHYDTFITEEDFAQIAAAGLNWVRIPLGFWAIETQGNEPFLEGVSWTYFLKAITWARKYGLRINLDFHAMPGSQNGWNHSGKFGQIGFMKGVMGIANAERALAYVRTLVEFISQPEYANVIPMFSYLNEARISSTDNGMNLIDQTDLSRYHYQVYQTSRAITGTGAGNGPLLVLHDGFIGEPAWVGFLAGADRLGLDFHGYFAFGTQNNDGVAYQATKPCTFWGANMATSSQNFGLTMGGEYSLAINDCGLFVNNVGYGSRYDGTYPNATSPTTTAVGDCDTWNDWTTWSDATKAGLMDMALASMSALGNSFFWTWKIGPSTQSSVLPNAFWHYKLGLENGWIPTNPRNSAGFCASYLASQGIAEPSGMVFSGSLAASATGGGPASVTAAQVSSFGAWPPPTTLGTLSPASYLPTLATTGTPITLSASTPTAYPVGSPTASVGNGWADASDTAGYYTSDAACTYIDPYEGNGVAVDGPYCNGAARRAKRAQPTSPPA
ncbi:glycoside hydrolase family 5 protein [Mixia osmundae IAM 14324]|uniref:glucan 1,3-beta-glucosidase n=1 Tax=Mixia osmundae (strain CBS 9802 / IAM 14324 / JCM 22182 / KY 12970) TaxID=764103 RepID=G7DZ35_MIXOS|nr:glycoside hydrolase family 5 protein [Mixia osmundae IAM 14324]KEI38246.1 glycoside hydrolase family 5 protein [Mixia osmundae IAM 14324]GAA95845.1 hypothetical protein E5Q_02502 [Mixia osmundae IAM 14324]